jgi:hypothetical protein
MRKRRELGVGDLDKLFMKLREQSFRKLSRNIMLSDVTDTTGGAAMNHNAAYGYLIGDPITASASGSLVSVGLNVASAVGNLRLGIYATKSATPTYVTLLGQSASTPAVTGWNDYPMTKPVVIVKGATYYPAFQQSSSSCYVYDAGTGANYYCAFGYAPFPDPSGTLGTGGVTWNMRIIYTPSWYQTFPTARTLSTEGLEGTPI